MTSPLLKLLSGTALILAFGQPWTTAIADERIASTLPSSPDPTPVELKPAYHGNKLSLNFQNIEVRAALQVLAEFTGLNIIASDSVNGTITLRLKEVPWDQALDLILRSKGLEQRRVGNVIHIAPYEESAARDKQRLEATQQLSGLEPLRTESFVLRFKSVEDFLRVLDGPKSGETGRRQGLLSERGSLMTDPKSNTLIVHDTPTAIGKIRHLIDRLDLPVKQVLIEARIVEAGDNFQRDLGVKLGFARVSGDLSINNTLGNAVIAGNPAVDPRPFGPAVDLPAGLRNAATIATVFRSASSIIGLELSALQAEDKGRIISSPRVMTADRTEATIEEGTEIPYQEATSSGATSVSFKKAVLSLKVKPQIIPGNHILMDLQLNKDTPNHRLIVGGTPAVDTKKIQTQVLVENGDTIVIGGIYVQEQGEIENKVPYLGDIPFLGALFRNSSRQHSRRELLMFITPRVVDNGTPRTDSGT
ncbi:type IV pilus secretin PilQ family protein [Crenobacter sp. SG2303]|uniref:Type IV pilus biogenesis and competence protein PilQ n=1 Tax=Crenobacter oryzisoli TaxID=3056844 RepID=A0ABT7XM02_9NEIS|nr:type IV pilus secretin PilQ family protein [Crenobacter sp. SG2303]MDN0074811.1 type IV pilus secretin PilQ family protein [Crenobacter sp. SG2303]